MQDLLAELQALESELHRAGRHSAGERLEQLLHPSFHEVGRSGRHYDRDDILRLLASRVTVPDVVASRHAVRLLADGAALLTYRSAHRAPDGGLTLQAHRCSVWLRGACAWQLGYHQGTPADEPPGVDFFRALEVRRTQALVARDLPLLELLHAGDYQLITPAGRVFTRAGYLAAVREAPFYAGWEVGAMQVRRSASMAVLRYRAELRFPSGRALSCWHTDQYECGPAGWQAVWSQATEIRAAE